MLLSYLLIQNVAAITAASSGNHEHGTTHGFASAIENDSSMVMTTTTTKSMPSIQAKFWLVATIDAGIIVLFIMIVSFTWAIGRIRRPWLPSQASVAYANGRASWLDLTTLSKATPQKHNAVAPSGSTGRQTAAAVSAQQVRRSSPVSRREMMLASSRR